MTKITDPFSALFALQRALDARRTSDWLQGATTGSGAFPPINIFQQGDDFVAIVELPGIAKEDLEVQAKEGRVRIFGKKSIEYKGGLSMHRRERVSGRFDRTFSVPVKIDPDRIKAEYQDGVLAVFVPRAESDKPRTIRIQ
jgi:HSP20 family protein